MAATGGDYRAHLVEVGAHTAEALELSAAAGSPYRGILFHSGATRTYHRDDLEIPFRSLAHFGRFTALEGPGHVIKFTDGRIQLFEFAPRDFWSGPRRVSEGPETDLLERHVVATDEERGAALGDVTGFAWVGDDSELAGRLGVPAKAVEPTVLVRALDWFRAYKTEYEIACIRSAAERAGRGHHAVVADCHRGATERQLYRRFLEASDQLESDVPFVPIIAWDDRASVLHYPGKRDTRPEPGSVLLVDAGAAHRGYASDTTRTYLRGSVHPVFARLVKELEAHMLALVDQVRPGLDFLALHEAADRGIGEILVELDIIRSSPDEAHEKHLTWPFFPHGLGHHLGLQVHDVGGHLQGPTGPVQPPPERYRFLRTTRPLEPRQVITIEPGVYFIPQLLAPAREGAHSELYHWPLIDELIPFGGVRVEDDIHVTAEGSRNLTRDFLPPP